MSPKKAPSRPIDVFVGSKIKNKRSELGLSQRELAEHIDVHYQQIQRYESGSVRVSASRLWALAKALSVRVDFFFTGFEDGRQINGAAGARIENHTTDIDVLSLKLLRNFQVLHEREKRMVYTMVVSMASERDRDLEE